MNKTIKPTTFERASSKTLGGVSLAFFLLLPSTVFCYEVTLGLDTAYVHDSNFYRTANDEESADSVEPGGSIAIEHQGDRLRYLASYVGSYQAFRKQDESDGSEHRLRLTGSYDIDRLTSVKLKNNFRDISNLKFTRDDIRDGDTGQDPRDNSYQRNDLELMLHRDISRSWELEISATQQFIDFERNVNRSDSDSIGIGGSVFHRFSQRHRFGAGLSWVNQDFDGNDIRLDAEADYVIADLAWIFDIGQQVQLVVNGGPAWISTEEHATDYVQQTQFVGGNLDGDLFRANILSCAFDNVTATGIASRCDSNTLGALPIPANDLGDVQNFSLGLDRSVKDDDVTFFGGVSLQGKFSDWNVDMDLRREQSAPSGDAIAAKLTRLRWEFSYAPANWEAYLAGSLERREAFSSSTIVDYTVIPGAEDAAQRSQAFTRVRDSGDRRDAFTVLLGVKRQFSRGLSGDVGVSFRHTERRVSGRETEVDTYFFAVKLSYVFDTFRF